jgi:hypothetical protein
MKNNCLSCPDDYKSILETDDESSEQKHLHYFQVLRYYTFE